MTMVWHVSCYPVFGTQFLQEKTDVNQFDARGQDWLNAQQTRMQIIANNLANVSTTGFKRDRANFETLMYQVRRVAGDQTTAQTNLTSSFSGLALAHVLSIPRKTCLRAA